MTIRLKTLLEDFIELDSQFDCDIENLCLDSRKAKAGDLFFAYPGEVVDGRDYVQAAIAKNVKAVVCDGDHALQAVAHAKDNAEKSVPIISLPKLRNKVGILAAKFYKNPAESLSVIGVTGTNGKSSVCHYIASMLQLQNKKCGIIGTLGSGFVDDLQTIPNTTPDPIFLQQQFYKFKNEHVKYAAIEVSSHALAQDRVAGINFDIAVFTNLTRDHLDYHKNLENYATEKARLFNKPNLRYAVINIDDEFGKKLAEGLSGGKLKILTYGFDQQAMIRATDVEMLWPGFAAKIVTPWGEGKLSSKLIGRFNLSNLLATITVLGIIEIPLQDILHGVTNLSAAAGRMQMLRGKNKPLIIVDYAHTPDALEKTLQAIREHCRGKLWCVFGCGGDRDTGKRPLMGVIAERYSDQVIITDDNPRTEDAEKIVQEISQGMLCPWAAEIEHDRRAAIAHAIECAASDDVVLIAGKGHEAYQILGKERIHFDDIEVAKQFLVE